MHTIMQLAISPETKFKGEQSATKYIYMYIATYVDVYIGIQQILVIHAVRLNSRQKFMVIAKFY